MELGEQQEHALQTILDNLTPGDYVTLPGAAGTGKTTVSRELIRRLEAEGHTVTVCAPTWKAVGRIAEALEVDTVRTLHSIVYGGANEVWQCEDCDAVWAERDLAGHEDCPDCGAELAEFGGDLQLLAREHPAPYIGDVLVIDEASMVGQGLAADMRMALPRHVAVIAIGDPHQLPPVGEPAGFALAGQPHELTDVYRQAEDSPVLAAATAIRQARVPFTYSKVADFRRGDAILRRAGIRADWLSVEAAGELLADAVERTDGSAVAIVGTHRSRVLVADAARHALDMPPHSDGPQVGERVIARASCGPLRNADIADVRRVEAVNFGSLGEGWIVELDPCDPRKPREAAILADAWNGPRDAHPKHRGMIGRSVRETLERETAREERERGEELDAAVTERTEAWETRKGEAPAAWLRRIWRIEAARELGCWAIYLRDRLVAVDSGLAITCHQSQGSQWDTVLVIADMVDFVGQGDPSSVYTWSYTALTRAEREAVIVKKAKWPR